MKARPILFSSPMIRALLDGRKVQTRRIVKGTALEWLDGAGFTPDFVAAAENAVCPYGEPGDLLWCRETWAIANRATDISKVYYKAHENASHTEFHEFVPTSKVGSQQPTWPRFKPSIHMPRWASRLTLELTEVRVERLRDISEADAIAEGVSETRVREGNAINWQSARSHFADLWRSIHGSESWNADPWVWCLTFRVHQKNVDALLAERGAA